MAVISGVPSREWDKNPLPPDQMVATRKYVNDLAGSQRVLSHGLLRPNLGEKELEEMERQVKELKIDAWKMYTGAELGEKAWFLDDEKVAYPFWERTKKLGVKNLCVHKGLPLGRLQREGLHAARPGEGGQGLAGPELHRLPLRLPRHRLARPRAPARRSRTRRPTTRRRSPGSATSSASSRRTRRSRTSTSSWAARSSRLSARNPVTLPAHARADDPGGRGRPHPLGHRLDLGRQPAEPDRAAAPAEDDGRS